MINNLNESENQRLRDELLNFKHENRLTLIELGDIIGVCWRTLARFMKKTHLPNMQSMHNIKKFFHYGLEFAVEDLINNIHEQKEAKKAAKRKAKIEGDSVNHK